MNQNEIIDGVVEIESRTLEDLIADAARVQEMRSNILEGRTYIVKNVIPKAKVNQMIDYLSGIGRGSFPNYHAIQSHAPNFHRINLNDPRAYVGGTFHQFVFFPWNQDIFDLFRMMEKTYHLKNLLSNLPAEKFLGAEPEDGCTSRIAFQFYPAGGGNLVKHADPVDHHQLSVPILLMSKKGRDFKDGGVYAESTEGKKYYFDKIGDPGDVVFFNAKWPHGVDAIDPNLEMDWTSFKGRWMMLLAVNKLAGNASIPNSKEL